MEFSISTAIAASRDEWLGERHDDYAGVLALRHQAEGGVDAAGWEGAEGQRLQTIPQSHVGKTGFRMRIRR
jgi:hypothetical protein